MRNAKQTMNIKKCTKCNRELLFILDSKRFWCRYCRELTTIIFPNGSSGPGKNPTIGKLLPDTGVPPHLLGLTKLAGAGPKKPLVLQVREDNEK